MSVYSIKERLSKFSARIRDYFDAVPNNHTKNQVQPSNHHRVHPDLNHSYHQHHNYGHYHQQQNHSQYHPHPHSQQQPQPQTHSQPQPQPLPPSQLNNSPSNQYKRCEKPPKTYQGQNMARIPEPMTTGANNSIFLQRPHLTTGSKQVSRDPPVSGGTFQSQRWGHQASSKSSLPPGFSKRRSAQGQIYYLDSSGNKHWYDPSIPRELLVSSLNLDQMIGKLSSAWEVRTTSSGKTYYVNHTKRTTQFTDPRMIAYKDHLMQILRNAREYAVPTSAVPLVGEQLTSSALPGFRPSCEPPPIIVSAQQRILEDDPDINNNNDGIIQTTTSLNNGDNNTNTNNKVIKNNNINMSNSYNYKGLYDKISILRQELLKQQNIAHLCKIDVNRKRIFEDSFRVVSQLQARDLKKRLLVKFRGEEGLDYGGVAREWFYLLSREILNPGHGLFQYTNEVNYNLQINPDSGIVYREHLSYLNFCGRIMGMAVFHGHFIEGHFTLPFYKMLLGRPINLDDIRQVDPELHHSLCWLLENDITDVLDTSFLVQHNAFGQLQEYELKENGRNIAVTEANKAEYVSLYVNHRCRRGIERQMESLQRGFHELVSANLLEQFDELELELLIGGLSKIDLGDWRQNTKLKNCNPETPIVRWFWNIVESYSEERRSRLLQFVTGSPRVPIQGFKALQGVNSELRLFTIHLIRNAPTESLPKSHTCFNRIDLPFYETYDKLHDKLTQAIEETIGFAMQ